MWPLLLLAFAGTAVLSWLVIHGGTLQDRRERAQWEQWEQDLKEEEDE